MRRGKTTGALLRHYKCKKVLVTGGLGFIGANLIESLKAADCTIVRLLRTKAARPASPCRADIRDVVGDMRKRVTWKRALRGIDVVFHLAAQTSVSVALEDPVADFETNVLPMLQLLEICRHQQSGPVVVFAGTVTQTGIAERLLVDEDHPDRPVTVYDTHKLMAETYLKQYARAGFVRSTVLRLANVYGPGPQSSAADRGVLNLMIRKALANKPLTLYGNGKFVRDYVFVHDVTRALLLAGAGIARLNGQHFVIGTGHGHTLKEAFNLVAERASLKTGRRVVVRHLPEPRFRQSIDSRSFVANSSKFRRATGWRAKYRLVEGIDRTIEAYRCES